MQKQDSFMNQACSESLSTGYVGLYDKSSAKYRSSDESPMEESPTEDIQKLAEIKKELMVSRIELERRGLVQSLSWTTQMIIGIQHVEVDSKPVPKTLDEEIGAEIWEYHCAKVFLDSGEYDRCAFFTEKHNSKISKFIHLYSRYLSGEKKRNIEDAAEPLFSVEKHSSPHLKELHKELTVLYSQSKNGDYEMDSWMLWLYGCVLKRLNFRKQAADILCESIRVFSGFWGAWLELAGLITAREMIDTLDVPDHWMKKLFTAHIFLDLHVNDEAFEIYTEFEKIGLHNSTYIKGQLAHVYHNKRDLYKVIDLFNEVEELDPFRLDGLDMYSNLLYVKEMRIKLSHLAHRVTNIDKYRMETCCVVGNYYSLRGQHEKAVQYFQRALRMNPQYLAGWTLMGHEYIEMKNTNAAIQCYRQAIEVNRRDYRAWYGLGQTYEVLKLPSYCTYYYKQAHRLHPNDSRTLIALGDCYDKLDKWEEAKKCYHKAHSVGDIEELALMRLAKLYTQLGEDDRAAAVYARFLQECDESATTGDKGEAFQFLANHCLSRNVLDLACEYAHKCTLCPETREIGKALLREIAGKRSDENKGDDMGAISSILQQRYNNEDDEKSSLDRHSPFDLSFS